MAGLIRRSIDFFWAALAATLIAAAALVTMVRLLLPEIGSQRANIEAWIAETVGRPAIVGEIQASWRGWSPTIAVSDIVFMNPEGTSELVRFDRASINVAPLGSIAARTLKPKSLVVSGVELTLIRHEDGSLSVAGMPPPKSPIILWLMKQNNFAVTEADLSVVDRRAGVSFALSDVSAAIQSRGDRKFITGHVQLPESMGRALSFEVSSNGNPLEPGWDGMINLRADGLRSGFLAERLSRRLDWQGRAPADAGVDVVAWSRWTQARLESARFRVAVDEPRGEVALAPGHGLRAEGRMTRIDSGWRLDLDRLAFPAVAHAVGTPALSAWVRSRDGEPRHAVLAGRSLPVEPLAALASRLGALPGTIRSLLDAASPSGTILTAEGLWTREGEAPAIYYLSSEISRLSMTGAEDRPGITGLDATLETNPLGGALHLDGADFRIDHDAKLAATIEVTDLTGVLAWNGTAQGIRLSSNGLRADASGTSLEALGSVSIPREGSPELELALAFETADGTRLHHLLPAGTLPPRGEAWSRTLFHAGTVSNGRVVVRGSLADFPFDDASGSLQLDFDVEDATLQYSRRWPLATDVAGHVRLRGREVSFVVERGNVEGADVSGTEATMPNMFTRERFVRISGTGRGPAAAATRIVMSSPLKNGRARRLQEVEIDGNVEVALDMNLAVYPGGPKEVLGQVRLGGNRMFGHRHGIELENVVGVVTFTRRDWYGEGLTADFHGRPVGLVMNGGLNDPNYDSEFRMTGTTDMPGLMEMLARYTPVLQRWLSKNLSDSISGTLPWKAVLTIPTEDDDGARAPQRLAIESSLVGLDVDLPWPFRKHSGERKPLRIETALQPGVQVDTRIDFGDTLDAEVTRTVDDDGSKRVVRAEMVFGSISPEFEGRPGITLRGYLPALPLGEWAAFLNSPAGMEGFDLAALPADFDVQVKELRLLDRALVDVRLMGTRTPEDWNVTVASLDSNGRLSIPHDLENDPLIVDLDRLHLERGDEQDAAGEAAATSLDIDPSRVPRLELRCTSFAFEGKELGEARIRTQRTQDGLRLEELTFSNPDFTISANGNWDRRDGIDTSHLNISVDSGTLTGLLHRFGYTVANIEGGATDVDIDAGWAGTPADFALDRITGTFELHVSDGSFLDIEPGGGRLFGLLSLQTLPRRLSLDFNDLFRKGFAFDNIDGVFEIESGHAYTNSLLMEGPAARIDVSGRIGLAEQDYDQHVVVTPALSSSIPVASALFGPIGVGAGAVYFIGGKMFKSIPEQVNKFLSREYSITGSWESPVIERI